MIDWLPLLSYANVTENPIYLFVFQWVKAEMCRRSFSLSQFAFWDKCIQSNLSQLRITAVFSLIPLFSQADKEFVWSLWKRLQVANPDLTQAVSLVVERWVDLSFKLLPERLNSWTFLYLTSEEKYVWKSFSGCLRHLGHSTGVTTKSGADADLSLLIPGLAVQPWKPF